MRKTILAATLALASFSALSADYFVVVPVPNRAATEGNIVVALSGYTLPFGLVGRAYAGFDFNSVLQVKGDPGFSCRHGDGVRPQAEPHCHRRPGLQQRERKLDGNERASGRSRAWQ
jgi:hypothetical protein